MSTVPGDRAKKGKRSRIVVNVEPKPPEDRRAAVDRWRGKFRARRTSGRRRRALLVAAIPFVVIMLLIFGGLVILAQGSAVAPFIYTLF